MIGAPGSGEPTGWLQGYGLNILSDWPLPGAIAIAEPAGGPDLRITTSSKIATHREGDPVYRRIGDVIEFRAQGTATYICRSDGVEIVPVEGCDPAIVTGLLIATALPAALWMRGDVVQHGAAVVAASGEGALLLCGSSGAGKSTIAAQLLAECGALLADDTVRLARAGAGLIASGLASGYHLGAGSGGMRAFHPLDPSRTVAAAPVRGVAILSQGGDAPGLTRLDRVAALEALLANRHRPSVPALLGKQAAVLATLALLARDCPVYRWRRPAIALSTNEREMLAREDLWRGLR